VIPVLVAAPVSAGEGLQWLPEDGATKELN